MAANRVSAKSLGLTDKEVTVLLYGILCPSPDGSRNPVDYEKLARELGYAYSSIKVLYGNARRKLIRETGISPATRGSAPATSGATDTSAGSTAGLGGSASAADEDEEGETSFKPRKVRRAYDSRKRKAREIDEEDY
ncbi:uncharacterized protein N7496_005330 [Penicillium cataractarum]|uniref:Uncharacterized protein n=1 Tax=Penicillium cataractarum TaxID=2100454 RepID=A0A9W9VFX0_9EURO|nr:uncharacterized protein N7496_005330 [Penicillium cataractarum]KAJ5377921.1 hypothetical protein N7496_005330 [Penicillium cataractarum]